MTIAAAPQKARPAIHVEPTYVFGCRLNDTASDASAATAARLHAAAPDVWRGPTGNAYAIPCRDSGGRILSPKAFGTYLGEFFEYAGARADQRFRVARFGCEQDGYGDADMAKLWRLAPRNCVLPAVWQRELGDGDLARILIFDPLVRLRNATWQKILQRYLALNLPLWGVTRCEFVSSGGPRNSQCTADAAKALGYPHREVRADPDYYKGQAEIVSDMLAVWHSTHLLSVTDPDQTSVPSHLRILNYATRDGLFVDDLSQHDGDL